MTHGDEPEEGPRTIRAAGERRASLAQTMGRGVRRLSWRTPLHQLRLRGRYPLKLIDVPVDPIPGDVRAGRALVDGCMRFAGEEVALDGLGGALPSRAFADHYQGFAWLSDLAAAAPREGAAPVAEVVMRGWLARHARTVDEAWRPDLWGRRILAWTAHAPLILSSDDAAYRKDVLNTLARGARHLDRAADAAPQGTARVAAWAGAIAAGLLIPGGDIRTSHGEAGIARALGQALYDDGGLASRSPADQLGLIALLARLQAAYAGRERDLPEPVARALDQAVPALLAATLGDGGLSSWQGDGPIAAERIAAVVAAANARTIRPLARPGDWGYQRLAHGRAVVVADTAPPPVGRLTGGAASTLAFELSDGAHRLIVNCGGTRGLSTLPGEFSEALRTTAAHSTLVLDDTNSTALHGDGSLGRGVGQVELKRGEDAVGSRLTASHDGYVKRLGWLHRRTLTLSIDGRTLSGEDALVPTGRRRSVRPFAIRFHLGPGVTVTETADGQGALLRVPESTAWQFRCSGGTLTIEDSVWIDPAGRPCTTMQLVVSGETAAGGALVAWSLRRTG